MRKTRSQTQAENGPSASTRSFARSAASVTKTSSSSSSTREKDHDKTDNPFAASNPPPPANQSNRQAAELDPAKLKEYQDMIQTFRVVDLHKVLQFLSLSAAGRKHELQQRVLDLLKTNFELVSTKLREIYRTDYYSERNVQYGPPDPKRMFSHMQMPTVQSTADVRSAMVSVGNVGNTGVGPNTGNGGGAVPANMGVPFQHNIGASMPIHPDVRLKKLAFYDVLATLIKPSSLLPRSNQRIQELPFYFTLTPQQATEIATNRDIRNGSKVEHSIQVQLRFCLLETSCEQEDCFPSNVIVKVNNKLCPLPNPIPTNRPNVEPKRPPRPVNVTSNVKLSPTVTNTITVQWCPDFSRGYCIAAYLVKKLTSSQLLHRMKTKGIKPADYTRGLIKEKLTEDADCEIATTMLKVSLNCPLGKMKMSIPCRASTCSHLQCFDANLYLQMNERKPTWNCPVCDKPAIYDHLVIDGYFQEVLASSLLGSEDTEIQLHKDGSWSTHNLRNETQLIDTPSKPVEKVELISDDIELITDDVKPLTKAPPPPVISNEPTSTTNSETVDLTLSDSDDDMPLAKRKTAAAKNATTSSAVSTSNGQRSATVQSSQTSKGVFTIPLNNAEKCQINKAARTAELQQIKKLSAERVRRWREKRKQLQTVLNKQPSSLSASLNPGIAAVISESSVQLVSALGSVDPSKKSIVSNNSNADQVNKNISGSSSSTLIVQAEGNEEYSLTLCSTTKRTQRTIQLSREEVLKLAKTPAEKFRKYRFSEKPAMATEVQKRLKSAERVRKWREKKKKMQAVLNENASLNADERAAIPGPSIKSVSPIGSVDHSKTSMMSNSIASEVNGPTSTMSLKLGNVHSSTIKTPLTGLGCIQQKILKSAKAPVEICQNNRLRTIATEEAEEAAEAQRRRKSSAERTRKYRERKKAMEGILNHFASLNPGVRVVMPGSSIKSNPSIGSSSSTKIVQAENLGSIKSSTIKKTSLTGLACPKQKILKIPKTPAEKCRNNKLRTVDAEAAKVQERRKLAAERTRKCRERKKKMEAIMNHYTLLNPGGREIIPGPSNQTDSTIGSADHSKTSIMSNSITNQANNSISSVHSSTIKTPMTGLECDQQKIFKIAKTPAENCRNKRLLKNSSKEAQDLKHNRKSLEKRLNTWWREKRKKFEMNRNSSTSSSSLNPEMVQAQTTAGKCQAAEVQQSAEHVRRGREKKKKMEATLIKNPLSSSASLKSDVDVGVPGPPTPVSAIANSIAHQVNENKNIST